MSIPKRTIADRVWTGRGPGTCDAPHLVMVRGSLALLALLAGCAPASGETDPPESGRARYHMRQHLSDVRTIERMLVHGKLEDARALAFMLTRPIGTSAQTAEAREVVLAAGALVNARTIDDAIYAELRVATACAQCHAKAQQLPVFKTPSKAPADRPTLEAQMARHQWAVDRLWEGLIGASDEHWRAGLYALATSRFPGTPQPVLAVRLQRVARSALDQPAATLEARAAAYGELLVTCAGCHAEQPSSPGPRDP